MPPTPLRTIPDYETWAAVALADNSSKSVYKIVSQIHQRAVFIYFLHNIIRNRVVYCQTARLQPLARQF